MGNRSGCGFCWLSLTVVVALAGFAGYRLFMGAHTHVGTDGRAEIALTAADRDIVLAEMRAILGAVQGMTTALTQDDLKLVAQQARSVGLSAMGQVPPSLMQALPLEFKTLGREMHTEFDQIALDAEQMGDREHALQQLGAMLGKCVACHATYRLTASKDGD
ncbi:MAG: cytochrome c [Gammaproteobacteria bacterium]|nr:cytochrome c [Gammaproteobacteria bacterium]